MALLKIKLSPKASRDALRGWHADALKVSVTAPPDKGKANAAVIKLLAGQLGVPASDIEIRAGHTNPRKTLAINNLDDRELRARIHGLLE